MFLIAQLCCFLIIVNAIITVVVNVAVLVESCALGIELSALHGLRHLNLTTTF